MESFEQKENEFNRNYRENFARNILGDYEPGLLSRQEFEKEREEDDGSIRMQEYENLPIA